MDKDQIVEIHMPDFGDLCVTWENTNGGKKHPSSVKKKHSPTFHQVVSTSQFIK